MKQQIQQAITFGQGEREQSQLSMRQAMLFHSAHFWLEPNEAAEVLRDLGILPGGVCSNPIVANAHWTHTATWG